MIRKTEFACDQLLDYVLTNKQFVFVNSKSENSFSELKQKIGTSADYVCIVSDEIENYKTKWEKLGNFVSLKKHETIHEAMAPKNKHIQDDLIRPKKKSTSRKID